jgi:hypothetical protein
LSDAERAEIEDQIDALRSDIAFMQREVSKENGTVTYSGAGEVAAPSSYGSYSQGVEVSGGATHGAYSDKILREQRQLAELEKKLQ